MNETERLKARVGVLEGVLSDLLSMLVTSGPGGEPTSPSDPDTPVHWHHWRSFSTGVELRTIQSRFEATLLTPDLDEVAATAHQLRGAAQKYADAHIETTSTSPSYDRVQS